LLALILNENLAIIQQIKLEQIIWNNPEHLAVEMKKRQDDYMGKKHDLEKRLSVLQAMIHDSIPKKDRTPFYIRLIAVSASIATFLQIFEFLNVHYWHLIP